MPSPGRTAMSKVVFVVINSFRRLRLNKPRDYHPWAWRSNLSQFLVYGRCGNRLQSPLMVTPGKENRSMFHRIRCALLLTLAAGFFAALTAHASDWPHWLGPN